MDKCGAPCTRSPTAAGWHRTSATCCAMMEMMGLKREDLIDGLDAPAGATTALLDAQGAATLFT